MLIILQFLLRITWLWMITWPEARETIIGWVFGTKRGSFPSTPQEREWRSSIEAAVAAEEFTEDGVMPAVKMSPHNTSNFSSLKIPISVQNTFMGLCFSLWIPICRPYAKIFNHQKRQLQEPSSSQCASVPFTSATQDTLSKGHEVYLSLNFPLPLAPERHLYNRVDLPHHRADLQAMRGSPQTHKSSARFTNPQKCIINAK